MRKLLLLIAFAAQFAAAQVTTNSGVSGVAAPQSNVAITGGTITGLSSPLPVASGGTGVTSGTGSGSVVLSASPTFTGTPLLGSATGVGSLNGAALVNASGSGSFVGSIHIGVASAPTGLATGTSRLASFDGFPTTTASAYTVTDAVVFFAEPVAKGSGSTVTNASGFYSQDQTVGTNNFGFQSAVISGSGKWNFYASGSASNAFAGSVRIGSTVAPTVALDVTGALAASGALTLPGLASSSAATTGTLCWTTGTGNVNVDTTAACLSSTIKVKEHIESLNVGLREVMALRPVSYDLKPQFNPGRLGRQVGLIAEEVAKTDDRLVAKDDKGNPRGVRYMQLTAVLVKAIQEQQAQIQALQASMKRMKH